MHPKFSERIAKQIHLRKVKFGWKPANLAQWLMARFPNLTEEDHAQIKTYLPTKK